MKRKILLLPLALLLVISLVAIGCPSPAPEEEAPPEVIELNAAFIFRGIVPFVVAMLICITILAIFPQIALFIPSMM